MSSSFAAVKSSIKKGMYLVHSDVLDGLIHNSFMECIEGTNINMDDRSCNTTDMKSKEFITDLNSSAWELISEYNDGYPLLFKNIIRA